MSPSINTRENREFASEVKFVVDAYLAEGIREWARNFLLPDPHAGGKDGDSYQVTSLYFDTRAFDVFHRNKSYGKSKYRIRRYGSSELVYLERKLKTRGMVSKRRSVVPVEHLAHWLNCAPAKSPVAKWFRQRLALRGLQPVCQLSYTRNARVAMTPCGPIRLTVDENLRAHQLASPAFSEDPGPVISGRFAIVEMKFLVAVPALFKHIIEEFRLQARPFSKYRFAASKLGLVQSEDYAELGQSRPDDLCLIS